MGSLALHAVLGVWLAFTATRENPQQQRPAEIWFEEVPAPPPPTAQKPPDANSQSTSTVRKSTTTKQNEDAPRAPPSASDAPRADPVATLVPSQVSLSPGGTIVLEPSRGETLHPDDPRFNPTVIAAAEKQRVTARVQGWAEDELAEARAQNGLPHPYFMSMREKARAGLDKRAREAGLRASPALAARALSDRFQGAAEAYGKGGNPNLGPPGQAPRLSEKITQPDQQALKGLAQATETFNDLSHGKPLLTLTLEFRQSKTHQTKTTILKASIDPAFDAFVLEAWPLSIASAGPPPPEAFHADELRSIWEIEGWPGSTPLDRTMTYLPEAGVMGVPLSRLIPAATQGISYEFRAKLLRVY